MKILFLTIAAIFSGSLQTINGQIASTRSEAAAARERERQIDRNLEERRAAMRRLSERRSSAPSISESYISYPVPPELTKAQKKQLKPEPPDAELYAAILKEKRAGLIKIFSDLGCEDNVRVLRVNEDCRNWIPGSATYSFRRKEYISAFVADIKYKQGTFISEGFLSQAIMVSLGDVALDLVQLDSDGMDFLVNYQPELKSSQIAIQYAHIINGVKSGSYLYRNVLKATENNTYAARIVAYRANERRVSNLFYGDKRIDVIIAFRLLRKNNDGSVTVLWRELQRRDAPKLIIDNVKKK